MIRGEFLNSGMIDRIASQQANWGLQAFSPALGVNPYEPTTKPDSPC